MINSTNAGLSTICWHCSTKPYWDVWMEYHFAYDFENYKRLKKLYNSIKEVNAVDNNIYLDYTSDICHISNRLSILDIMNDYFSIDDYPDKYETVETSDNRITKLKIKKAIVPLMNKSFCEYLDKYIFSTRKLNEDQTFISQFIKNELWSILSIKEVLE